MTENTSLHVYNGFLNELANSKEFVLKLCEDAFLYRDVIEYPKTVTENIAATLRVQQNIAKQLLVTLSSLIRCAIFEGCSDFMSVQDLFPDNFHKNLKDLLSKIIADNISTWRNRSLNNQISLPRLVDFDWRVDLKTSTDTISRMSMPTCILQLKVQETAKRVDTVPDVSSLSVELSKETLDTMLDGLSKIRDQLSSVAKRT
ncbi:COMM domain-containing protein 9-like [Saccoglossus kowalevskii]|uniref:COMM domain-containing protein 9-like n=1 Tax=Saccoglossus kowalevskii TaxID=10224 RepID=A0ABM0MN13_SACKO|nr:PREDICTED: COMM domain-containing protein 9-like [Saccoglossus kowalevskii]